MAKKRIPPAVISLFIAILVIGCARSQDVLAPAFTLSDMNGHQVSLTDYKGQKAVLLLFFNYQTGGGQDPLLRGCLALYRPSDKLEIIPIVNISTLPDVPGRNTSGKTPKRLTDFGYAVPLKDDNGSVSQAFGANPDRLTLVLVDRDGCIRFRQEVTATAETNAELARQIQEIAK